METGIDDAAAARCLNHGKRLLRDRQRAVRDAPAVASTANVTTAGPLPKGEPTIVIQPTLDRADHRIHSA